MPPVSLYVLYGKNGIRAQSWFFYKASSLMSLALLFPGQGSQHLGMGQDLARKYAVVRHTFEEADDILGFSLSGMMWGDLPESLTKTENTQPALYVHSLAVYRLLQSRLGLELAAAGHSLGEFSAHGAAGTFTFADGLRLVRRRGELMALADETAPGTMAAALGMAAEAVAELCQELIGEGIVVPANLNARGQVVVSGEVAAVRRFAKVAKERGAKKVIELEVSAAFHSPLMEPAAAEFKETLENTRLTRPSFPVISNVTAEPAQEPEEIRELLVRQLTSPVRWIDCIERLKSSGADQFAELGPGQVLTGLNRRNARGLPTTPLGTVEDVKNWRRDA